MTSLEYEQAISDAICRLVVPSFDPEPVGEVQRYYGRMSLQDEAQWVADMVVKHLRRVDETHRAALGKIKDEMYALSCNLAAANKNFSEVYRLVMNEVTAQQAVEGTI